MRDGRRMEPSAVCQETSRYRWLIKSKMARSAMIKMLHFWLLSALEATNDKSLQSSNTSPLLSMVTFFDLHVGMCVHFPVAG